MNIQKKEIGLTKVDLLVILGFILALAVLCFTLGVRIGKKKAMSDYSEDYLLKLKNEQERLTQLEKLNTEIPASEVPIAAIAAIENESPTEEEDQSDETTELSSSKDEVVVVEEEEPQELERGEVQDEVTPAFSDAVKFIGEGDSNYKGRYTIAIGEFLDPEEAGFFAEAFSERGYDAFIQKRSKGGVDKVRVSLGSFKSETEALELIKLKDHIFLKNKYHIEQF